MDIGSGTTVSLPPLAGPNTVLPFALAPGGFNLLSPAEKWVTASSLDDETAQKPLRIMSPPP